MPGEHGEEGGFADAGAGEEAEALASARGGEAIQDGDAEVDGRPEAGAAGGWGRRRAYRAGDGAVDQWAAVVERLTEGIDDPAQPGLVGSQRALAVAAAERCACWGSGTDAAGDAEGCDAQQARGGADDFGQDWLLAWPMQVQAVAHAEVVG